MSINAQGSFFAKDCTRDIKYLHICTRRMMKKKPSYKMWLFAIQGVKLSVWKGGLEKKVVFMTMHCVQKKAAILFSTWKILYCKSLVLVSI